MRKLDFLILGAQKSGTTTLFRILSEHPGVVVPTGKELPFFNHDGLTSENYSAFMDEHFRGLLDDVLVGKVTPHYLCDPAVAPRLKALSPDTRLAVILRDPVERAFSHYRMSVRRGLEARSFSDAMSEMLQPEDLARARALPTGRNSENQTYIAWGEYGRLMAPYAEEILRGNFLVLSTRELESDPAGLTARLMAFLDLEMVNLPSIGKKAHQGGDRERLPLQSVARSIGPVRWLWRRLPRRVRSPVQFHLDQWNVVKGERSLDDQPAEIIEQLRSHFRPDAKRIEELTGWQPDWS